MHPLQFDGINASDFLQLTSVFHNIKTKESHLRCHWVFLLLFFQITTLNNKWEPSYHLIIWDSKTQKHNYYYYYDQTIFLTTSWDFYIQWIISPYGKEIGASLSSNITSPLSPMLKETIKGMTKKLKLLVFLYDFQATIGLRLYGTLEGQWLINLCCQSHENLKS